MNRWRWHGGGLAAARAHYGEHDGGWLDLSTGINPHPWPGVGDLSFDWAALPDERLLHDLEAAAAGFFGADPACVCAVPGTEVGLRLTGTLIEGPACYAVPTYRSHASMIEGSLPVADCHAPVSFGRTLILANPNNPDGRVLTRPDVLAVLEERGAGGWLIVDEAFADVTPQISVAPEVGDGRRLVVFRSFGKFFGLAGVRLGFVLGPPSLLERLRERLGAWPLSSAALAIGLAAYRDRAWSQAMRVQLASDAAELDAALRRYGLAPKGDCPLFRLVETDQAQALFERLARQGILTRPFDYAPNWLRLGLVRDAKERARLEQALDNA